MALDIQLMSGESELSSDVSNGAENEVGKAYKVDHGMPLTYA